MNKEYLAVISEVHELEAIIAGISEGDVIERRSFESRLKTVRELLATTPKTDEAQKVRLTFRGKPVLGSHGMFADFAAKAAGSFEAAFALVAAGLEEGLQHLGAIPSRERNQLLITGTAIGSFGFEFELPSPTLLPDQDNGDDAMKKIETLFRLAAKGSDDEIAEVVDEIHPRAVKKVHEFLDFLVKQEAWCGLEFGDRKFRFESYDQLKQASDKLRDDNIQEREENFAGEIQGALPDERTFEFKVPGCDKSIRCKINTAIDNPGILNRKWLYVPSNITLNVIQVGNGRSRFALMSLDNISARAEP